MALKSGLGKIRRKICAKVVTEKQRPCICVVDDDDAVRDSLELFLSMKGLKVLTYGSGQQLLENERNVLPNLLILDIHMPEMDGFELLKQLRQRGIDAPIILMSGLGDRSIELRAKNSGVAAFFNKPIDPHALYQKVVQLIDKSIA